MIPFLPNLRARAVAIVASLVMAIPASASAFCRTRTIASPPDYDAVSNGGCWSEGVPLFWRNNCVGYSIHRPASRRISYEDAALNLSIAFTRWTGASCPTDGTARSRPSIDVRDLGPVDCADMKYRSGVANQNVIVFRDESWKHGKEVLGLTIVQFDKTNGEIYGADMELNTYDMDPLALRDPVEGNAYDFLSVATHEAGHFLGFGHSDIEEATMFARYQTGSTTLRSLAPDDVNVVCSVYRPNGDRPVLDGQVTPGPQCDPTPRGGYSQECLQKDTGLFACATGVTGGATGPARSQGIAGATLAICALALLRRRRQAAHVRAGS